MALNRADNPTYVEGYVGFSFSDDGKYILPYLTDYKEGIRNKKFAYRVRIPIPQEVLDAAPDLEAIEGEITAKLTFEVIEREEPVE